MRVSPSLRAADESAADILLLYTSSQEVDTTMNIVIRRYTVDDYEGLLDVQKEAFPPPFPPELWWKREQIEAHVRTFPEGAMVAVSLEDGRILGSATALIVRHADQPHTWAEISDNGYIERTHDPDGDTLYGIDVCVRPSARGLGVAGMLYDARKRLVVERNLARLAVGSRMPGYHRYADETDAETYVERVVRGELRDPVLSFMLKQGLVPVRVLHDYLEDEESCNKAVLMEWRNPFYSPRKE